MQASLPSHQDNSPEYQQDRTLWHSSAALKTTLRTAESHASFLLSRLRSGMSLLDCGCGPGTITAGLAKAVAPGQVIGLDLRDDYLQLARANASRLKVSNVKFEKADMYRLPFAADTFDVAFSSGVFIHLGKPTDALKEMYRVLRPGGVLALREVDWDGQLASPTDPLMQQAVGLYQKFLENFGGGDIRLGRKLRALLHEVGLAGVEASASYESFGTSERVGEWAEYIARLLEIPEFTSQVITSGWSDPNTLEQLRQGVRKWGQHPDAFFALAWCEAIGWKEQP